MNGIKKICRILMLPTVLSWFLMTCFVDMIAVPTVFRNVSKLEEAGRVGMKVFSTFNHLELAFAIIFAIGTSYLFSKTKKQIYLVFSLILLVWSLMYNFYFTPQIIHYTHLIHQTSPTDPIYIQLQSGHAFYHTIYRYLDSTKLFMLLTLLIMLIKFEFNALAGEQK